MEKVHHYAYQLFDAVDFLHHKLKIVHCDIKRESLHVLILCNRILYFTYSCLLCVANFELE